MSISEQITRLQNARNSIHDKLAELGLGDGTEKLEVCAEKIAGIANKGTINLQVQEGSTHTVEPGYYKGGSITGIAGGGNYELETPDPVTPTKSQQVITPSDTGYGLQSVTVLPIPSQYQDVSEVNAEAKHVLSPFVYVDKQGVITPGTMVDNKGVVATMSGLTDETSSYTIPEGYHDGTGTISLTKDIENALAAI